MFRTNLKRHQHPKNSKIWGCSCFGEALWCFLLQLQLFSNDYVCWCILGHWPAIWLICPCLGGGNFGEIWLFSPIFRAILAGFPSFWGASLGNLAVFPPCGGLGAIWAQFGGGGMPQFWKFGAHIGPEFCCRPPKKQQNYNQIIFQKTL